MVLYTSALNNKKLIERSVKACLDIIVLSLLKEKEMCGYEIIASIHKKFHTLLSPGMIYPLLYKLEEGGLIETKWVGRKKNYMINNKDQTEKMLDNFINSQKVLLNFVDKSKTESNFRTL